MRSFAGALPDRAFDLSLIRARAQHARSDLARELAALHRKVRQLRPETMSGCRLEPQRQLTPSTKRHWAKLGQVIPFSDAP